MGEIGEAGHGVLASAGEDDPSRVGAPVVEALGVGTVGLRKGARLHGLEVEDVEVGLWVVDREIAVVCEAIDDEATVVGGARQRYAMPLVGDLYEGVNVIADASLFGVEADGAQVVAHEMCFGGQAVRL